MSDVVYSMNGVIPVGYAGENEAREIAIDIRPLVRAWPDLAPVLLAKRPGENALYPCVTRMENGVLYWRVTLSDTAIQGKGECVIHMIDGEGRVGKSRTMTTMIERSASGEEAQEPPAAIRPWIDDVLASIESVKAGYVEVDQGEENAGLVLVVGDDGRVTLKKGGAGGDGVGVESVEQTQESVESGGENVWTLRLTDGTTSRLIVRNGAQGPTGPAGMNGVSPTVTFGRIEGGYRLSIVDATGTHSAEIMDGADGPQGPEGPRGIQGPVGERGPQGERGAPFAIAKVYASQDAMNAGYASDGVAIGGFVLIETGDVNDEENARLYVKGESRYEYVTDLSGAQGIQGPEGKQGPQGPAGNPGKAGADGKDGTSVTVKSVSESSADGGSNVVTFSDGKTLAVKNGKTGAQGSIGPTGATGPAGPQGPAGADGKNGTDATVTATNIRSALGYKPASEEAVSQLSENIDGMTVSAESADAAAATISEVNGVKHIAFSLPKGAKGDPGKTPVKGTDYWTPADQESIVQQVIAALGTPVFGTVDENKHIALSGHLADGTYTISFEDTDGFTTEVCTITKAPAPTYTNLFDPATATLNTRMSGSNSAPKSQDGYVMTASIPIPATAIKTTEDADTPYIVVPASMWSGSANVFYQNGQSNGYIDFGATKGTVVGAWVKLPVKNQWTNTFTADRMVVSLYVKGSAITTSDIQDIEIYFNEMPD